MAERIQRHRTAGWRMPEGAVYVGRPSFWGNSWTVNDAAYWGIPRPRWQAWLVGKFREEIRGDAEYAWRARNELAGKDLVCWCPLDQPCHADVLLEIANGGRS